MNDDTTLAIEIFAIAEEYIEGFRRCLDAVARERRYLALVQAPPLESAREVVLSNIANGVPQLVAVRGSEVIGWCDIRPQEWDGFSHCGRLGMGVRADFRGHGIGRRLIEATLQRAGEKGLERVELEVFASNTPAIRLYESLGFVVEGIKRRAQARRCLRRRHRDGAVSLTESDTLATASRAAKRMLLPAFPNRTCAVRGRTDPHTLRDALFHRRSLPAGGQRRACPAQ
jgi:ribosomal protein S18 acetylase RimI-like enzyme